MNHLFSLCLAMARRVVEGVRDLWPGCDGVVAGKGVSTQYADFLRKGTSDQTKEYVLPAGLTSLVNAIASSETLPAALASAETGFLNTLLSRNPEAVPERAMLESLADVAPGTYTGSTALANAAAQDPWSAEYETGTRELYDRLLAEAKARAQSGPDNVRGATARGGFEQADVDVQGALNRFKELHTNKLAQSSIVQQAVQLANAIESARSGTKLQAQGQLAAGESNRVGEMVGGTASVGRLRQGGLANIMAGAELLGKPKVHSQDDLHGKGFQMGAEAKVGFK